MKALLEAGAEHLTPRQARVRLERQPQRLEAHLARAARWAPTREALSLCVEPAAGRVRQELTAALDELSDADADSPSLPLTRERLARLLEHSQAALHMLSPPRVTLLGAPNVGKSSLFNRLLGFERSLIADRPGTTRDRLVELAVLCPGLAIRLTDTGGLDAGDELAPKVSAISRASARQSALLLWVLDASRDPTPEELHDLRSPPQATVVAFNKLDLVSATDAADLARRLQLVRQAAGQSPVCVSALTGTGLPALRQALRAALGADGVLPPAQPTAATKRTVRCAHAAIAALDQNTPARAHGFVRRALSGGAQRHETPRTPRPPRLMTSGTGREDQHDH
jgi:small GTP-binding protein